MNQKERQLLISTARGVWFLLREAGELLDDLYAADLKEALDAIEVDVKKRSPRHEEKGLVNGLTFKELNTPLDGGYDK